MKIENQEHPTYFIEDCGTVEANKELALFEAELIELNGLLPGNRVIRIEPHLYSHLREKDEIQFYEMPKSNMFTQVVSDSLVYWNGWQVQIDSGRADKVEPGESHHE